MTVTEDDITITLLTIIMTNLRLLRGRDMSSPAIQEALITFVQECGKLKESLESTV